MNNNGQKIAIVTGGGTGVGKATSLQLARRGFSVIVNYSRSGEDAERTVGEIRASGHEAISVCCDVSRESDVQAMIADCEKQFGRIDVVVNNAGTTHFVDFKDLGGMDEAKWDELLAVNLKGAYFVCRAAIPVMQQTGGGAIVNVASVAGVAGAGSSIAYAASKGGMITLTKSLALGFAPDIRVNAVCPGVIESRWLADHREMLAAAIEVTPLKRASTPDDIADVVTFLACDAKMMTGQSLIVDGGRTI